MKLILASGSPRRLQLLEQLGLEVEVRVNQDFEEATEGMSPCELVAANAVGKGESVAKQAEPADVVIAADTIVVLDNAILGKPASESEAIAMLEALSGREHTVLTGVAVFHQGRRAVQVTATQVQFIPLTPQIILDYVATKEPLDKAGAYGIQGRGARFVESIHGSYTNVVGLPLAQLYTLFAELDVTLHEELLHQGITDRG